MKKKSPPSSKPKRFMYYKCRLCGGSFMAIYKGFGVCHNCIAVLREAAR
jgi:ribosomal protein S14